jgi:hypothetical protein
MRRSVALAVATAALVVSASIAPRVLPAQVAVGNVCSTAVGRYPGPSNALGSPCTVATLYGPASGVIAE